ncbi:YpzG family protein [Bacillus alkalicellulosilyticus]|nr:YpzG family protein [Bacillus alkalicellulosilyticus]
MSKAKRKNTVMNDPFQSPRANPKHAAHQVNGETEVTLHNYITLIHKRKG